MITFKRGDVVLVYYPNSDLKTFKKRPALIIQSENLDTGLSQKIVAMITSKTFRVGPSRVRFNQGTPDCIEMGLVTDSVVLTDNISTIQEREIDRKMGYCNKMPLIDAALKITLGL